MMLSSWDGVLREAIQGLSALSETQAKSSFKCDLRKEGCSQCERVGVTCRGYRDTESLRVRDQTWSVAQRVGTKLNLPRTVTISLQDRARAAFFSNYVFDGSKSYDFLQPFYNSPEVDPALSTSLDAASLAFYAHQENARQAGKEGHVRYISALSLVQKAIASPVVAKQTSTLLASMVLDLYEKITNTHPDFDASWKSHVKGSLALLRLREELLVEDRHEFKMLVRLTTNLLISCVATDTYLPEGLLALRAYESSFLDTKDPKWLLSDLMLRYVSLKEVVGMGQQTDRAIIASVFAMDAEFANLAASSPEAWQARKVWMQGSTERVLRNYFDIFLDHHITQTHNVGCLIRILLNELLIEYASSPAGVGWAFENEGRSLRTRAGETIHELVDEICASVPQYTHPPLVRSPSSSSSQETTPSDLDSLGSVTHMRLYTPAERVRAYTLIFPLFVAGQSVQASRHQKDWIIRQLHFMASAMGIKNAEAVANILKAGVKINPWKVYALLGSYAFAA